MSTPSKDELSLEREKGWWNADLEGRMDKLAVEGAVTSSASGSKNLDGKADRWSAGVAITKRKMERLTAAERQEMDGAIPEIQPASWAEGPFVMCEVEEQQAARVEVQRPKRRAAIRVETEETQDYVFERRRYGDR